MTERARAYVPTYSLRWERGYRSTFWELHDGLAQKRASQQRVRRLLGGETLGAASTAAPPAGEGAQEDGASPSAAGSEPAPEASGVAAGSEGGQGDSLPDAPHLLVEGPPRGGRAAPPPPAADAEVWGVGQQRTLAQYEEFAGVDLAAKRVGARAERGGLASESCFYDRYASLEAMFAAREAESK